jgi:hypothetical protein
MPRNGHETAPEWLKRVSISSSSPEARSLARYALEQWNLLLTSWKQRGVRTRRNLWDLLSGILQIAKSTKHQCNMIRIESGNETFYFPILLEACHFRGKDPPSDAVKTGIMVRAHRRPQTTKWGNIVLKT